jgi:hypothetical protein
LATSAESDELEEAVEPLADESLEELEPQAAAVVASAAQSRPAAASRQRPARTGWCFMSLLLRPSGR